MGDNRVCDILNHSRHQIMSDGSSILVSNKDQHNLSFETARLETFANWPSNAPVDKKKLAKAGFYYTGRDHVVRCYVCHLTVSDWEYGEQVWQKHARLSPHCKFISNQSDNVPTIPENGIRIPSTHAFAALPLENCKYNNLNLKPVVNGMSRGADERTWSSFMVLRSEAERLKTFKGWPCIFIKPEDLAKDGFFYLKDADKVQCFFCKGIVGEWERDDVPSSEHRRHFPNCPFVKGLEIGNIPINGNGTMYNSPRTSPSAEDVAGRYKYEMEVFSGPEKGHINGVKEEDNLSGFGITKHRGPKHPNYTTMEARLRSFELWPPSIPQNPKDLAHAGFYYAGVSDHVRCFHCDGGLRNWEATDSPWIEHARWFGNCSYVQLVKGCEFVNQALLLHPPAYENNSQNERSAVKDVTMEEVNTLLSSPLVKTVADYGVALHIIRYALLKKLRTSGQPFNSDAELFQACMQIQEEELITNNHEETNNESEAANVHSPSVSNITNSPRSLSSSMSVPNFASGYKDLMHKTQELSLAEENQRLKEMQLCKICMDEEMGIVFLPCGHLISCPSCAPSITDCPVCRKQITHTVRTYLT